MDNKVVPLNRAPTPIAHYLRLGQGCHRQLEELHDSGALPFKRFVADASRRNEQRDLLQALVKDGKEIVLDTNMAELGTNGGASGQARHLPWAKSDGAWRPGDMDVRTLRSVTSHIADTAVEVGCHAVHSPSHLLLQGASDPWLPIDIRATELLRDALNRSGGAHVSIDYVLTAKYATLRDPEARRVIVRQLADIPFENLWLRIEGFGANSTGAMVRQYISAVNDILDQLGPQSVIADCAGGIPVLAACAFGATGGLAHGVGEKESFDPRSWTRPRTSKFGGRTTRIYIPRLGLYLTANEFEELWSIRAARAKLVCPDQSCCGRGKENMLDKQHVLRQRANQVATLGRIPELSRPNHFVYHQLEDVGQTIRTFERIKALDNLPQIKHKVSKWSGKIDRLSGQLQDLMELRRALMRSSHPRLRGRVASASNLR